MSHLWDAPGVGDGSAARPGREALHLLFASLTIAALAFAHYRILPDWLMEPAMSAYIFPLAMGALRWGAWAVLPLGLAAVAPLLPHLFAEHGIVESAAELLALSVVLAFAFLLGWRVEREAQARRRLALARAIAVGVTRDIGLREIAASALEGLAREPGVRTVWVRVADTAREVAGSKGGTLWQKSSPRAPFRSVGWLPGVSASRIESSLRARGRTLGWLGAEFQGWAWQRSLTAGFIEGIARELAVAMDNRVLHEVEQRAVQEIQGSEARYRSLFDRSRDAVLLVSPAGRIEDANEAAQRLLGSPNKELAGLSVDSFLPRVSVSALFQDPGKTLAVKLHQLDGALRDVEAYAAPLAGDNPEPTIQLILRDVTEHNRAQSLVRRYVAGITRAQEEERRRIAREIHDDTIQSLAHVVRRLDGLQTKKALPPDAAKDLEEIGAMVGETVAGLRRFSQNLRPSVLDDLGLAAAVEWLTERVSGERLGAAVQYHVAGKPQRLAPEVEVGLFRITQEALNNAVRHAHAQQIRVELCFGEKAVTATVSDDGRGFHVAESVEAVSSSSQLGLLGMMERTELLGARLHIQSAPGKGTVVRVEMPLELIGGSVSEPLFGGVHTSV